MTNETSQADAVPSKMKGIEEEPKADVLKNAEKETNEQQKPGRNPIGPQHDIQSQQMQAMPQKKCAEPQQELNVASPDKDDIIDEKSESVLIDQNELVRKALNSISLEDESIESLKLDSSHPQYHKNKIAATFRHRIGKHIQSEMQFMT